MAKPLRSSARARPHYRDETEPRRWKSAPHPPMSQKSNAAWASHPSRTVTWIPALPLSPLRGGRPLQPDSAPRNAAFAKASCGPTTLRSRTASAAVASKPSPDQGSGEEAATPGATSRVSAFLEIPAGSAAIIRHSGLSRFRCTHFQPERGAPQYKSNLRLCRTCGRSPFLVEERGKLREIYSRNRCRAPD